MRYPGRYAVTIFARGDMTIKAAGSRRFTPCLKGRRSDLAYSVGANAVIVAEQDYFYTLYQVAATASDGSAYRHLLIVPTNVSAVSFDVGLALEEAVSAEADMGRFAEVERLANAMKWDFRRYHTFPPPLGFNRFGM